MSPIGTKRTSRNVYGRFRARCLPPWRRFMPNNATSKTINAALLKRFGAEFEIDPELTGLNELEKIAGHRSPTISKLRGRPFANDHLDLFFNAVVDAAIALATFIRAAEAVGLGCCPISAIRDHPRTVSDLLHLPNRVIPVAGICVGWPAQAGEITPRLSLSTTVIENKYDADDFAAEIDAYDRRRAKLRPYHHQRNPDRWGDASFYGWSEDKARQYAEPMRTDFGSFVRGKGFCLD